MEREDFLPKSWVADELRAGGPRAVELLAGYAATCADRPVSPGTPSEQLAARFRGSIPERGVGLPAALDEFAADVLPHSMGIVSPRYMGLINTTPLPGGVIGDLLVSGLNNNAGAWEQSPAASAIERELVRWLADLVGLPPTAAGMIVPGGTYANLHGLLLARTARLPDWDTAGPTSLPGEPRIYTSDASHFSVERAARIIGLGASGVVTIESRGRGALDPDALDRTIQRDRDAGRVPFAVVATAGTTATGAIDPIAAIAEICRRHQLWLHVDACYGGAALLLSEFRTRLAAVGSCDSISIDPHKWFFMPLCAAVCLTPHRELEPRAFAVADSSYVPDGAYGVDAFLRGVPTSRRASSLALWLALRAHGVSTIRDAVRRNIRLARRLEARLAERGFDIMPDGELSTACARAPAEHADADALQAAIARRAVDTGEVWFGTARHRGRLWLRFNLANLGTRDDDIDQVAALVADIARADGHRAVGSAAPAG